MFVQWMRGQRIAAGGVHSYTNITHPQPQSCPLQDWQPERGLDIFCHVLFYYVCASVCEGRPQSESSKSVILQIFLDQGLFSTVDGPWASPATTPRQRQQQCQHNPK
jgi:hypothetical protein